MLQSTVAAFLSLLSISNDGAQTSGIAILLPSRRMPLAASPNPKLDEMEERPPSSTEFMSVSNEESEEWDEAQLQSASDAVVLFSCGGHALCWTGDSKAATERSIHTTRKQSNVDGGMYI